MKPVKSYWLVTFGVILGAALLAAPSAFAESTALCDLDPGTGAAEVCPEGHLMTEIHEANLSGSKEKMSLGLIVVECDVLFQGATDLELANPQFGTGTYTYTNCNNGCTVTEGEEELVFEQLKEGHEKAKFSLGFEVRVVCNMVTCRYFGSVEGKRWGPLLSLEANGEVSIQKQTIFTRTPGLCAFEGFLTLRTTPLVKTFVTK